MWATCYIKNGKALIFFAQTLLLILCTVEKAVAQCETPSSLYAQKQNDTLVTFEWLSLYNDIDGIEDYDAEYKELNSNTWLKAPLFASNYELAYVKIEKGKCYELRVRMLCTSNGYADTSDWASMIYFDSACVNPPPPSKYIKPNFSFLIDPCGTREVSFSNLTSASGISIRSIEWDLGDNTKSKSDRFTHVYQKPGIYEVILTVMDDSGKTYKKADRVSITNFTRFAKAGSDITLCTTDSISLQASGGESYSWSPCLNLTNCRIANPKVFPGTSGDYFVTVTNKDGCIDSDTVSVKFRDPAVKLYVPNAFTPNNDGINDLFRPLISLPGNVGAEWKLFNRFGNLVFSSKNNTNGWNGNYQGQPQPSGNYTYLINLSAENNCPARQFKGTVLLMR
ncbi:MAG TPA: T9SS type B sorting domain-containing protein [Chitinophagaceae bacterium]|nr:T9SS type B sorting domain-containing protein [Chitinophagaceae bacterium]